MMAECLILGNSGSPSSGNGALKLSTLGYTAGNTLIEDLGVPCMPFLAKAWSGTLSNQVTQGTNGITLTEQGYIAIPFSGFNLPSWQVDLSMHPTALLGSAFTTFITLYDIKNSSEFGVSYYKNSDRVYYAVASTSVAEPMSEDVVSGAYSSYEDNGFKSANILNGDFSITFICDETYITVYLNDSPRVRVPRSKATRSDDIQIRVGCCLNRSDIRSFAGEVTDLEINTNGETSEIAQIKTVTPSLVSQAVLPDNGYYYLSQVNVNAIPIEYAENTAGGNTVTIG